MADWGAEAVIRCNPNRKRAITYAFEAWKARITVERCFNELRPLRRIAARPDRRAACFPGFLQIAAALLWVR